MNLGSVLSYSAAALSLAVGLVSLSRDPRSFVHRAFAAGFAVLAAEALFTALSFHADSVSQTVFWQRLKIAAGSLAPGVWLVFSITFARADYGEFVKKWAWILAAMFAVPAAVLALSFDSLVGDPFPEASSRMLFPLETGGYILSLFILVGAVLILMNLEKTFRLSVGHTRWQIKFLVLGIGSIFGARIYTESQAILVRLIDGQMEILNVSILLLAECLVALSFWRTRLLKFDFYPSHSLLYNSVTVLLVGIYFIAVGVAARLVFYLTGAHDPAITALVVLIAVLVLAVFLLSDRARLVRKRMV
ncbi:MAG TPA: histidine kinase N-terminal 7TM domain-containing protein, partial [Thermodesulfobacteriota bacterium]|nr:histidine kinase N-terminal 7TM domain-containing protein [Thermodesulfobacteriota bacterium]